VLGLSIASLLYFGVVSPMRREVAATLEEYRKVRDQKHETQALLGKLEQREASRQLAASLLRKEAHGGDSIASVRRSVLASVEDPSISGVRLFVSPGRAPVVATVQLSAEGTAGAVERMSGHVARPGTGLVLERAHFASRSVGLSVELNGFSVGQP